MCRPYGASRRGKTVGSYKHFVPTGLEDKLQQKTMAASLEQIEPTGTVNSEPPREPIAFERRGRAEKKEDHGCIS
jgi:hypothetical protein